MLQPAPTEKTLLETTIMQAMREDIAARSDKNIWNFLASACPPIELAKITSTDQAREKVLQMIQSTATGPLLTTLSRHIIRKALELAAEKAQVREVVRTFGESRWEVDPQSILDIEKLFYE